MITSISLTVFSFLGPVLLVQDEKEEIILPDSSLMYIQQLMSSDELTVSDRQRVYRESFPEKVPTGIVSQRFYDTRVDGFSNNRGEGHCTQFAAGYWKKHFDVSIPRRGNALQWFGNAQSAGRKTGQDPKLSAFVITDPQQGEWSYAGHVSVIVKIDQKSGMLLVEEANFTGTHENTHRWLSPDDAKIVGYIYLPEIDT